MDREQVSTPADAVTWFTEQYPDLFTEGYIVEEIVEVIVDHNQFRLEAYRSVTSVGIHIHYDVHAYTKEAGSLKPYSLPYCNMPTATKALMQAMGFLWDRFRQKVVEG